jgi:hypothetical protein
MDDDERTALSQLAAEFVQMLPGYLARIDEGLSHVQRGKRAN